MFLSWLSEHLNSTKSAHGREEKRIAFNHRVISAKFDLRKLSNNDVERLRRFFARKIIAIKRLGLRPGDFELLQWENMEVIIFNSKLNIGGTIGKSDTYDWRDDVPELSLTLVEKHESNFRPLMHSNNRKALTEH